MARILRGDIIWANLDPTLGHEQAGSRPVLILSQDIWRCPLNFSGLGGGFAPRQRRRSTVFFENEV